MDYIFIDLNLYLASIQHTTLFLNMNIRTWIQNQVYTKNLLKQKHFSYPEFWTIWLLLRKSHKFTKSMIIDNKFYQNLSYFNVQVVFFHITEKYVQEYYYDSTILCYKIEKKLLFIITISDLFSFLSLNFLYINIMIVFINHVFDH